MLGLGRARSLTASASRPRGRTSRRPTASRRRGSFSKPSSSVSSDPAACWMVADAASDIAAARAAGIRAASPCAPARSIRTACRKWRWHRIPVYANFAEFAATLGVRRKPGGHSRADPPMPELAEVEFFRRRWATAARRPRRSCACSCMSARDPFRRRRCRGFAPRRSVGSRLVASEAAAKQMAFHFSGGGWLGLHLGMSGELRARRSGLPAPRPPRPPRALHLAPRAGLCGSAHVRPRSSSTRPVRPPAGGAKIAPAILGAEIHRGGRRGVFAAARARAAQGRAAHAGAFSRYRQLDGRRSSLARGAASAPAQPARSARRRCGRFGANAARSAASPSPGHGREGRPAAPKPQRP